MSQISRPAKDSKDKGNKESTQELPTGSQTCLPAAKHAYRQRNLPTGSQAGFNPA
jgi:hypothetical protein